jgi:hypothetical protein
MKRSLLLLLINASLILAGTGSEAERWRADLEQRLQSLNSLEIRYEAQGTALDQGTLEGRMIWIRPDRFYHDTPEWTLCEAGGEQWRLLKAQNTLIREAVPPSGGFLPEDVLFNLRNGYRATGLEKREDGGQTLSLEPEDRDAPAEVTLGFARGRRVPDALQFRGPDGAVIRYWIVSWEENLKPDSSLFEPPRVPPENVIDFRGAAK